MRKIILTDMFAFAFILLLAYAALTKLTDFENFRAQLGQSPLLTFIAAWMVWLVPITEIIICIMLSVQRWRLTAFYSFFTLMIIFTAYIVAITQFSTYVPCSCGGILSKMTWNQHLIFNLFFVALAAIAVLTDPVTRPQIKNKQLL